MNRWVFRCGCILEGQFVCLRAFCECISTVSTWQWVHARIKDALNSLLYHSGLHLLASIHLSLKHYTMGHHQTGPGSWNMPSFCVSKHFLFNACKIVEEPCTMFCALPCQCWRCTGTAWMRTSCELMALMFRLTESSSCGSDWAEARVRYFWDMTPLTCGQRAEYRPRAIKMGTFLDLHHLLPA